ncbi:hypothetical protein C8Q76DRAFT_683739 [Earliella scabrosa]|nr:hypothetical protein C8Q76DRAFT_683739 [Earliella scabrosa]
MLRSRFELREDGTSRLEDSYHEAVRTHNRLVHRLDKARLEVNHFRAQAGRLEDALENLERERREIEDALRRRTSELQDAQRYLAPVNDIADQELLHIVGRLNATALQTAATVADAFENRYGGRQGVYETGAAMEAAMELMRAGFLGDILPGTLQHAAKHRHVSTTALVQVTLQGTLMAYVNELCTTWSSHHRDVTIVKELYDRIKEHEPQSVSGRWRALSHTYLKTLTGDGDEGPVPDRYKRRLLELLTTILLSCYVPVPGDELLDEVRQQCWKAVDEITTTALRLRGLMGAKILSRDISLIFAPSGIPFDDATMADDNARDVADGMRRSGGLVLCTTQLGLIREERHRTENEIRRVVLLKPQVTLWNAFPEIWNEKDNTIENFDGMRAHTANDSGSRSK